MDSTLIAACEMFLIPSTILFAALGIGPTVQLKTLISLMGIVTSGTWFVRVAAWAHLTPMDRGTALVLSGLFLVAWIVAFGVHACNWYHQKPTTTA